MLSLQGDYICKYRTIISEYKIQFMSQLSPNTLSRHASTLEAEMSRLITVRQLDRWNAETLILGGSYFRGSLLIELCEAFEVEAETALSAALAVELIHNASLIHDDIMDHDFERRGRPSGYAVLGASQALLFGDVLIAEAYDCLANLEIASRSKVRLIQLLSQVILNASRGQSAQLDCESGMSCTLDACMEWSRLKTGMLFALPVEMALILADRERECKLAVSIGVEFGLAYQIMDDLFDCLGCKRGREKPSDNRNAEWTFARVAERDFVGSEAVTMVAWMRECFMRIDTMKSVLPAATRMIFNEVERGMQQQIDALLRAQAKSERV
ncbi:MAG TPA: hypothetical protein DCX06_09965 [Opitutae bacterium]|nr:hypothetical protein [Opitutae bacterium]